MHNGISDILGVRGFIGLVSGIISHHCAALAQRNRSGASGTLICPTSARLPRRISLVEVNLKLLALAADRVVVAVVYKNQSWIEQGDPWLEGRPPSWDRAVR